MTKLLEAQHVADAERFLDADARCAQFRLLGEQVYAAFPPDKEGRINTQVRNLQQIAVSARRLSDVENFVKNQTGKQREPTGGWRQVARAVLEQLAALRSQADQQATDEGLRLQIRLHLVRGWVRAVVGAYLYMKACREMENKP